MMTVQERHAAELAWVRVKNDARGPSANFKDVFMAGYHEGREAERVEQAKADA